MLQEVLGQTGRGARGHAVRIAGVNNAKNPCVNPCRRSSQGSHMASGESLEHSHFAIPPFIIASTHGDETYTLLKYAANDAPRQFIDYAVSRIEHVSF